MRTRSSKRLVGIVLGSSELGSAIAVQFEKAGLAVVLCDDVGPPWMRRGMSFVDAWYLGTARVEETSAIFCSSARSIPTVLSTSGSIAATTWSWPGIAEMLPPVVVVDARTTRPPESLKLMSMAPRGTLTVGVNPWYVAGRQAHLALWPWRPHADADVMAADTHRKSARACAAGRFHTSRKIGEFVLSGESIGVIDGMSVLAPATGVLSGLAARGCRIQAGMPITEVDTRARAAQCFAIPPWCESIAGEVVEKVFTNEAVELA